MAYHLEAAYALLGSSSTGDEELPGQHGYSDLSQVAPAVNNTQVQALHHLMGAAWARAYKRCCGKSWLDQAQFAVGQTASAEERKQMHRILMHMHASADGSDRCEAAASTVSRERVQNRLVRFNKTWFYNFLVFLGRFAASDATLGVIRVNRRLVIGELYSNGLLRQQYLQLLRVHGLCIAEQPTAFEQWSPRSESTDKAARLRPLPIVERVFRQLVLAAHDKFLRADTLPLNRRKTADNNKRKKKQKKQECEQKKARKASSQQPSVQVTPLATSTPAPAPRTVVHKVPGDDSEDGAVTLLVFSPPVAGEPAQDTDQPASSSRSTSPTLGKRAQRTDPEISSVWSENNKSDAVDDSEPKKAQSHIRNRLPVPPTARTSLRQRLKRLVAQKRS